MMYQMAQYSNKGIISVPTFELRQQDLTSFIESLSDADLVYHGEALRYCFVPIIFTAEAKDLFSEIVATTSSICEKVTQHYQGSEEYRKLWGLDHLSEDLALLPKQYSAPIPIMRADIFINPQSGDFKFCEINTDGSSAMNEDRCCAQFVIDSPAWSHLLENSNAQAQELFEPFIDDILTIFNEWSQGKSISRTPQVAIVDYPEEASTKEFLEFQRRFTARGIPCKVVDIKDLYFEGGSLFVDTTKIDVVYRRAIAGSIIDDLRSKGIDRLAKIDGSKCNGAAALVSAATFDASVIIGGFSDLLAHSKQLFEMLWSEETWTFLSSQEIDFIRAHVPITFGFAQTNSRLDFTDIYSNKNSWILKPKYGSSTIGVFAGLDYPDAKSWIAICEECLKQENYIIQEYCEQFSELNIIPQDGSSKLSAFNYMIGLFGYCGKYSGTYVRAGKGAVIGSIRGSAVVASFHKKENNG
ncbi:MAG: hypothetical protein LBH87_02255 [Coriobacteriales bacterium]|jgi:hypothetical protein|nr:hypothetical protein [Coriobacteriales bacterium]